jgi:predicted O-methyltransferase YrrM
MIQKKLIEKFGNKINEMSCVYIADGENSFRKLLGNKKYNVGIEIGTYQGVSTAIMAEYCKKVYAVDIIDLPLRNEIFDFLNIKNVDFYKCEKDFSDKEKHIKNILKNEKVDLAFIDGDHWGEALKQEWDLLKEVKTVIIHDYEEAFPIVKKFCDSIDKKAYKTASCNLFFMAKKNDKPKS